MIQPQTINSNKKEKILEWNFIVLMVPENYSKGEGVSTAWENIK